MLKNLSLKKTKRFLFVIISDTHAGHRYGLLNPETKFIEYDQNGNDYLEEAHLTRQQEYLWHLYEKHINEIKYIAHGDPIIVLHNGDLTIGQKYPQQMSYTALSNQVIAAYMNMIPWFRLPNLRAFRLSYGTQSHELYEGSVPRLIYEKLKIEFQDKDTRLVKHGLADVEGLSFDYSHHGPYPGSRKWLEGNVARYYLRDCMLTKLLAHQKPADFYIRSHFHTPIEEYLSIRQNGMFARSWLFITPSYQLMGDHAQQATRSKDSVTNGCLLLECLVDKLVGNPQWLMETSDIRTKEVIKI